MATAGGREDAEVDEVLEWIPERRGEVLPILAVTSANYKQVFSFWESSLRTLGYPRHKIHVVDLGELPGPHGYCTDSWRFAIDRQLQEVVSWIGNHFDEYFIHTDTDIQFFPHFMHLQCEWLKWMKEEGLDMIFMRERTEVIPDLRCGEVNAGFCLLHCNSRTRCFWQKVLQEEQAFPKMDGYPPYTDQFHLNRGLQHRLGAFPQEGAFGVRWATIPDFQCIWGMPSDEVNSAAFHHAVNTQDKVALLRSVREKVRLQQPLVARGLSGLSGIELQEQIHRLADAVAGLRGSKQQWNPSDVKAIRRLLQEVEALAEAVLPGSVCADCGFKTHWRRLRCQMNRIATAVAKQFFAHYL
ncbi:unnamed protein product [Durusdinium trenchii]|uniref:Nucleotide-diphospho-sugar transferase domain-containing protein n=2 Tax=Durusdinium trenchii TaxID=1381693 RepID=A0ABP0HYI6_9DINO